MGQLESASSVRPRLARTYAANPTGSSEWRRFRRVRLLISVGAAYHEGDKLRAAVDWVNRCAGAPFEECEVLVGDTLQRHNDIGFGGLDPRDAHEVAARRGTEWIERNLVALEGLCMPWTIARWDAELEHPRYPAIRAGLARLYQRDRRFSTAIDSDASGFLRRRLTQAEAAADPERCSRTIRDYLLEEFAVAAILAEERPAAEIYPARQLAALDLFRRTAIPGAPPGLSVLSHTRIRFKRRRNSSPAMATATACHGAAAYAGPKGGSIRPAARHSASVTHR